MNFDFDYYSVIAETLIYVLFVTNCF